MAYSLLSYYFETPAQFRGYFKRILYERCEQLKDSQNKALNVCGLQMVLTVAFLCTWD